MSVQGDVARGWVWEAPGQMLWGWRAAGAPCLSSASVPWVLVSSPAAHYALQSPEYTAALVHDRTRSKPV